jgi:hypothetical protein
MSLLNHGGVTLPAVVVGRSPRFTRAIDFPADAHFAGLVVGHPTTHSESRCFRAQRILPWK